MKPVTKWLTLLLSVLSLVTSCGRPPSVVSTPTPAPDTPVVLTPLSEGEGAFVPDSGSEIIITLFTEKKQPVARLRANGVVAWNAQGLLTSGQNAFREIQTAANRDHWYRIITSEVQDGILSITAEPGIYTFLDPSNFMQDTSRPTQDVKIDRTNNHWIGPASFLITEFRHRFEATVYMDMRNYNRSYIEAPTPTTTPGGS